MLAFRPLKFFMSAAVCMAAIAGLSAAAGADSIQLGPAEGGAAVEQNGYYLLFLNTGCQNINTGGTCVLFGDATGTFATGTYQLSAMEIEVDPGPIVGDVENYNVFFYGFYSNPGTFLAVFPSTSSYLFGDISVNSVEQSLTNKTVDIGFSVKNGTTTTAEGDLLFTPSVVISTIPRPGGGALGPFEVTGSVSGDLTIGTPPFVPAPESPPPLPPPPSSVPEPGTWILTLLGFASLGFAGYRRSSAAHTIRALRTSGGRP